MPVLYRMKCKCGEDRAFRGSAAKMRSSELAQSATAHNLRGSEMKFARTLFLKAECRKAYFIYRKSIYRKAYKTSCFCRGV